MRQAPPRLLDSEHRRKKAAHAGAFALLLLGAGLTDPDRPLPFDVCGLKYLTGLPCPTCGLTRAFCHAVQFDLAGSLGYHPAGPLLAMLLVGLTVWSAAEAFHGQPIGEDVRRGLGTALLSAGMLVSIASWIVRLTTGIPAI